MADKRSLPKAAVKKNAGVKTPSAKISGKKVSGNKISANKTATTGSSRRMVLDENSKGHKAWPKRKTFATWLLPFAALTAGSTVWGVNHIEGDLERATITEMRENYGIELSNDDVDFDYRDGDIQNVVLPAGVSAEDMANNLERTAGLSERSPEDVDIRDIDIQYTEATAVPTAVPVVATAPLNVDAEIAGGAILLTGEVLNQAQFDKLNSAAVSAVGESNVTNQLTIADAEEAKPGADARVDSMAAALAAMNADQVLSGTAHLDDDVLSVSAVVADDAAKDSLEGVVNGANGDVAPDADLTVAAPDTGPINVDIQYDGATITLNGDVLSEAQRNTLVGAAEAEVGADNVVDNLTITGLDPLVPDADAKIGDMAVLLTGLDNLQEGSGTVTDNALEFTGIATDDVTKLAFESLAGNANETTTISLSAAELSLEREVQLLQEELDLLQDEIQENVIFDPNSDEITDRAAATLDKVAAAMNKYQRPVVAVDGHTDSDGPAAENLDLSDRRAKSVRQYLVERGISEERLVGTGYGEEDPVVENSTAENKQQNRRVAFTAQGTF